MRADMDDLLECSFLIPVRRDANFSDGEKHDASAWQWLKSELFALFEGATRDAGLHDGFYKDPDTGRQITDKSYRYHVAVPGKPDRRTTSIAFHRLLDLSTEVHLPERCRASRIHRTTAP